MFGYTPDDDDLVMSVFSQDRVPAGVGEPMDITRRKQQSQQPRQLLSCTKCRERKVKCDRTKPCSACCARGSPKECHFVTEGGDYAPIQQSYELRKLRAENLRLKERLRSSRIAIEDDDSDQSSESPSGDRSRASSTKRRAARQKRFQGFEWSDSIYFGSPGLASIIADFAILNLKPNTAQSLAHHMPRGPDIFTPKSSSPYPFATLFPATPEECIPQLLDILPSRKELMEYLAAFEKRARVCAFPHLPVELTKSEIERFLADAVRNARMCPDMLALIFAAIALGAQHSVWDKAGGKWRAEVIDAEAQRGNVYIAASMQALRISSFMHKPSLLAVESLIMIGPFLCNSGRFLDAWTLFGTTIRVAQAIGLHRHPKYLDPAPASERECSIRQTLWWWMLHMDEQYSMVLGRPLGLSGIGDCPPPHELTTDPQMLRLSEYINHFTILARQILSSDRMSNTKIDEFTDLLLGLLDTMPELLQFEKSWLDVTKDLPEWPLGAMAAVYHCKTHSYLILLNRQRTERPDPSQQSTAKLFPSVRPANKTVSSHSSPAASAPVSPRGRTLVSTSSAEVLTAFLFFYSRAPASLVSWSISQQAFNSAMLLLLDALETHNLSHIRQVEQAYVIFGQLQDNGVHKLAGLAVEKLSWGLDQLRKNMEGAPHSPGVLQDETKTIATCFYDTIMANSGMYIPEDPGLQSYKSEQFAPLSWVATEAKSEAATTDQFKKEQEQPPHCKTDVSSHRTATDPSEDAPIAQKLQRSAESPQELVSGRPLSNKPVQTRRCATALAPPKDLAELTHLSGYKGVLIATASCHSDQEQLAHLPQSNSQSATARVAVASVESSHIQAGDGCDLPRPEKWAHTNPTARGGCQPATQPRHSSCPTTHVSATTPPLLQSTYSSPLANREAQTPINNDPYGVHTPWSANSAGPKLHMLETEMCFTPISEKVHAVQAFDQQNHRQQAAYPYGFAHHSAVSSTDGHSVMAAQHMTVDQWKRWVGSGA